MGGASSFVQMSQMVRTVYYARYDSSSLMIVLVMLLVLLLFLNENNNGIDVSRP